jgi:hypothetical protein
MVEGEVKWLSGCVEGVDSWNFFLVASMQISM